MTYIILKLAAFVKALAKLTDKVAQWQKVRLVNKFQENSKQREVLYQLENTRKREALEAMKLAQAQATQSRRNAMALHDSKQAALLLAANELENL